MRVANCNEGQSGVKKKFSSYQQAKSRSELRRFYSKTISSLLLPNQNTLETFKRTLI